MAGSSTAPRNALAPDTYSILWPALQVGGLSGATGLLVGSVAGVLKSTTPALFALASGIQWFTLGGTFWITRDIVLQSRGKKVDSPRDKVFASIVAGGVGGSAGGLLRGRKNVLPGLIMFAFLGGVGQNMYNMADAKHNTYSLQNGKSTLKTTWLTSKWSPVKMLSDEEYEGILREKLLRVNAEIALVDDSIASLRSPCAREQLKVKHGR